MNVYTVDNTVDGVAFSLVTSWWASWHFLEKPTAESVWMCVRMGECWLKKINSKHQKQSERAS